MAQNFKTTSTRTITEETCVEITAEQLEMILYGKFGGKDKEVAINWDIRQGIIFGVNVTVTKERSYDLDVEDLGEPLPVAAEAPPSSPEYGACYVDYKGVERPHIFIKRSVSDMTPICERCGEAPVDA